MIIIVIQFLYRVPRLSQGSHLLPGQEKVHSTEESFQSVSKGGCGTRTALLNVTDRLLLLFTNRSKLDGLTLKPKNSRSCHLISYK